jgi:F-type H+-transporting ATPase subunit b
MINMGTFYWLATEAAMGEMSESAGGFGLSFDILEANLVNLSIVIALVVYFGRGFLGKILSERQSAIATAIQEAEQRKRKAAEELANEQQKLAQSQQEAQRIRDAAAASAKAAKAEILARAAQEVQRLRETATQDTTSSQERAILELRQQVAAQAIKQVEVQILSKLGNNQSAQQQLVDRSIALLGGKS